MCFIKLVKHSLLMQEVGATVFYMWDIGTGWWALCSPHNELIKFKILIYDFIISLR